MLSGHVNTTLMDYCTLRYLFFLLIVTTNHAESAVCSLISGDTGISLSDSKPSIYSSTNPPSEPHGQTTCNSWYKHDTPPLKPLSQSVSYASQPASHQYTSQSVALIDQKFSIVFCGISMDRHEKLISIWVIPL